MARNQRASDDITLNEDFGIDSYSPLCLGRCISGQIGQCDPYCRCAIGGHICRCKRDTPCARRIDGRGLRNRAPNNRNAATGFACTTHSHTRSLFRGANNAVSSNLRDYSDRRCRCVNGHRACGFTRRAYIACGILLTDQNCAICICPGAERKVCSGTGLPACSAIGRIFPSCARFEAANIDATVACDAISGRAACVGWKRNRRCGGCCCILGRFGSGRRAAAAAASQSDTGTNYSKTTYHI